MRRLAAALALATSLLFAASPSLAAYKTAVVPPAPNTWVVVTDIHFDPFADPSLVPQLVAAPASRWRAIFVAGRRNAPSGYGKDTNFALLESSLAGMQHAAASPQVVLVAGDLLAHGFNASYKKYAPNPTPAGYDAFVDSTVAFVAHELDRGYPHAQFVVTLGNNDGYCGDYQSTPGSPFLRHLVRSWAPLVDRGARAPDFARSFPDAGYYVANLPHLGQAVVLNAVLWSASYANACAKAGSNPGAKEVAWLNAVLAPHPRKPKPRYRWILGHIPPGADAYGSSKAHTFVPMLQPAYQTPFLASVVRPASAVRTLVDGHTHMASFRVVANGTATPLPLLIAPSVSPLFANNPAFVVAQVDDGGTIAGVTTYVLPLKAPRPTWQREYTLRNAFGLQRFDGPRLVALQARLATDAAQRARFITYYTSSSGIGGISASDWPFFWCANAALTPGAFNACTAKTRPLSTPAASPTPTLSPQPTATPALAPAPSPSPTP